MAIKKKDTKLEEKESKPKKKRKRAKLNITINKFNTLEMILMIVIACIFGIFISGVVNNGGIRNVFTTSEIEKVYNNIISNYYEKLDEKKLSEAAINGMMEYLQDNYSIYMDTEESETFNEKLDGTYIGIGTEITYDAEGIVIISAIYKDSPAEKVGLKVGDKFLKVNGENVKGLSIDEVASKIKNKTTAVKITIEREKELEFSVTPAKIDINSINKKVFNIENKKIGYIGIGIFASNTDEQFEKALLELEKENIDSLIIDVRSNEGGHLDTVTNILNLFFGKDKVLYQIKNKDEIKKHYGSATNEKEYSVAVLVNQVSASASELLASAFKEISNSDIVGMNTFGKGSVQTTMDLKTGGMIKITTQTWLTSKGNTIDGVGIAPTTEVEIEKEYFQNPSDESDNQLQKAIEVLKGK